MAHSETPEGVVAAARKAVSRSQYRVSVSPAGILALDRDRAQLAAELALHVHHFGPLPPPPKPRIEI